MVVAATLALVSTLASSAAGDAESPAPSPRTASYTMQVQLDPEAHELHGTQVLTWTNQTSRSTSELRYHLYYNAWRNDRSSWFRTGRGRDDDLDDIREGEWAYSEVRRIELLGDDGRPLADLTARAEFVSPDDDNPDDRTVLRVPLPMAVEPGSTIGVRLEFDAHVPRAFARTGVRGDYYFLAQWFPKVGVLESDGRWACHQFIQTEFYADFGVYDVSLRVPTPWVVGATGRRTALEDHGDGTTTHRFVQADVHDFAWTTAPDFDVHERRFEHEGLPSVDMRLLLRPEHADHRDRYFDATAAALRYYGTWWGPYPYGHVTIVDPAHESGSGGMEYPTLFTGGTRWLAPPPGRSPEGVTVHEMGHQYWYGIVANDEFEHAWLDEGFNTYSTTRTLDAAFPEQAHVHRFFGFFPVVFDGVVAAPRYASADKYRSLRSGLLRDPQSTPSWRTSPDAYSINAYDKGALTLRTLENYLGWPTFQAAMAAYFDAWKFRHPRPQDFFATLERSTGVELDWFFDQVWRDAVLFDYAVGEVWSHRVDDVRGWDGDGELLHREGERVEPAVHRSVVHARRWGDGVYPVAVEVSFEDGSRVIEHWDGKARWIRYDYERPSPVTRVRVDPDDQLALDIDSTNDSWLRDDPSRVAAGKWAATWMVWAQATLEAFALFS